MATLGEFRVDKWSMTIRLLLLSYVLTLIGSSTFLLSGNDLSEQKKKIDPWKDLTCNSVLFCFHSLQKIGARGDSKSNRSKKRQCKKRHKIHHNVMFYSLSMNIFLDHIPSEQREGG